MDLMIDPEFTELIPPLSDDEFNGLENNILTYGYNKKYPITVWDNKIIDGHHRYKICKAHNVDFPIEEMQFDSRSDVIIWMIDNQKNKRNANKLTLAYLIGRQYLETKNKTGENQYSLNRLGQNDQPTSYKIAENSNIGEKTVRRAAEFSKNLDEICNNTGIKRQDILLGNIKTNQREINDLSNYEIEFQARALYKALNGEAKDLKDAISKTDKEFREERAKQLKEEEAKRKAEELKKAEEEKRLEEEKKRIEEEQRKIDEEKNRIKCEVGTWYKLGEHLLYCGSNEDDSFKDMLKEHPASFAFADPPYNADAAEWDSNFTWSHDWLIDNAPIVAVTPGIVSIKDFMAVTHMPYVWSVACWIDNGMTRGALGFGNWIYVALFARDKVFRNSQDFLRVSIENSETKETDHKGRKPFELVDWLISKFTKENDYIIDPFLGSGTSLLVAEGLPKKRKCIGAEINPGFCNEIIKRWEAVSKKKAVIYEN